MGLEGLSGPRHWHAPSQPALYAGQPGQAGDPHWHWALHEQYPPSEDCWQYAAEPQLPQSMGEPLALAQLSDGPHPTYLPLRQHSRQRPFKLHPSPLGHVAGPQETPGHQGDMPQVRVELSMGFVQHGVQRAPGSQP
jgi:hypothetical protein